MALPLQPIGHIKYNTARYHVSYAVWVSELHQSTAAFMLCNQSIVCDTYMKWYSLLFMCKYIKQAGQLE